LRRGGDRRGLGVLELLFVVDTVVIGGVARIAVVIARGFGRIEAVQLTQLQSHVFID
jgi:hypothetical protein